VKWPYVKDKETLMYPNPAISAGAMAAIVIVVALGMAIWIGGIFVAAREPRHRAAGATTLPQRPADTQVPQDKAA
jgi:hypothetical protein